MLQNSALGRWNIAKAKLWIPTFLKKTPAATSVHLLAKIMTSRAKVLQKNLYYSALISFINLIDNQNAVFRQLCFTMRREQASEKIGTAKYSFWLTDRTNYTIFALFLWLTSVLHFNYLFFRHQRTVDQDMSTSRLENPLWTNLVMV